MKSLDLRITLLFLIALISMNGYSQQGGRGVMRGVVKDKTTSEPLIGANVAVKGLPKGASTNANGEFEIAVAPGTYVLVVSYISYNKAETEKITVEAGKSVALTLALEPEAKKLADVVVRSKRKANTEMAMITSLKSSALVVSGVSSQQIAKTQDRDASEVVRRIPGISVVDGKFIVIRGLAQRYNNVWMNGAAVPSSEADSRAFSFDMIPSSQLDNITVVKSSAPELPADFSGGFVQISTKDATESNSAELSYGAGINDQTQFKSFRMAPTGKFDLLGFDGGTRALSGVPFRLNNDLAGNSAQINEVSRSGFNNDWGISSHKSFSRPEQRLSLMLNRKINVGDDKNINLSFAANYSNSYKALHNMENALIGSYDIVNDRPNYFFKYTDNQYNAESKVGAMLNLSYALSSKSSLQLRNVVNQQGRNRLTERVGDQLNSGYYQEKQEFLYSSRLTYAGQLSGNHNLDEMGKLDWSLGYSLSNKNQPDRRTISRDRNINNPNEPLEIDFNDTKRLFVELNENVYSGAANYQYKLLRWADFAPTVKAGVYGEYKNRDYDTRSFYYILNETTANTALKYQSNEEVFNSANLGTNGIYAYEDTRNTDSYKADNTLGAGYLGINIPISKLNIYGGVRFENNKMSLTKYVSMDPTDFSTKKTSYTQSDLFPSLNTTYSISSKQLVRLAYGATVNRPEFRELSPSTYYDFELFSFVKGNEELKTSYIQNIDLRYELYPSQGEMMTVALFYKNFKDPIESTYYENAGGYTYSYTNAKSATNIGAEVDMKKDLGFVGLKSFSLSVNAAYIHSRVKFDGGNTLEHSRPMQGQSPYLVNTGLFYQNDRYKLTCGLLYNVIGERIVGVGRRVAGNPNISVPDIYERPRNLVDFTFNVALSKYITLSGAAKNLLSEDVVLEQQAKFTDANGASQTRNQTKQRYNPGRSYSLSLGIKL
jgi:TonB-dependent receptor